MTEEGNPIVQSYVAHVAILVRLVTDVLRFDLDRLLTNARLRDLLAKSYIILSECFLLFYFSTQSPVSCSKCSV